MLSVTNRVMHGKLTGQLIRDQFKTRHILSNLWSISVIERVMFLSKVVVTLTKQLVALDPYQVTRNNLLVSEAWFVRSLTENRAQNTTPHSYSLNSYRSSNERTIWAQKINYFVSMAFPNVLNELGYHIFQINLFWITSNNGRLISSINYVALQSAFLSFSFYYLLGLLVLFRLVTKLANTELFWFYQEK